MTVYRVVFVRKAQQQVLDESARWREAHPKNTYLLEDELQAAAKLLAVTPRVGGVAADVRLAGARRMVLERSGFLLFYRVLDEARRVEVLSLWYARRRRPNLSLVDPKRAR